MTDRPRQDEDRQERGQRLEVVARDRWRDRSGVSGLATAAGVSRATLYSWFRGDTTPDLDAATRLADALAMPPSELLAILGGEEGTLEPRLMNRRLMEPSDDAFDERRWNARLSSPWSRTLPGSSDPDPSGTTRSSTAYRLSPALQGRRRAAWPDALASPAGGRRLLDVLLGQPVMTCQPDEPIGAVVQRMFERGYSQLPVYRGENLVGLLTGDTMARWFAAAGRDARVTADRIAVSDVLAYAESGHPFELVGPDTTVAETLFLFGQAMAGGEPLTAVLVTSDATAAGKPLGIVTVADLPRLGRFG